MSRIVYIAGKITGDPDYQKKFDAAAEKLEAGGDIVVKPSVMPEGLRPVDYMRVCFAMIESADTVCFLPDWLDSSGAKLEYSFCRYIGKDIEFIK